MLLSRRAAASCMLLALLAACALHRIEPPLGRLPPPPPRIPVPPAESNLVVNGSFERVSGEAPVGWEPSGRDAPEAVVRSVRVPDAPEGERVAEISLARDRQPGYGLQFDQDVRVEPWTTYELSVWVRGIDLVSAVDPPRGFGQQCGLFFWLFGPRKDPGDRHFPSGAFPRNDGTTPWELRTMRFTTPPAEAFPPAARGGDGRFHLSLTVMLFGMGAIQVDDVRLARSSTSPPAPRRSRGSLSMVRFEGKPFFGLGLYWLPTGLDWSDVAREKIFNFTTGADHVDAKLALGIRSMSLPFMVDPSCRGCEAPSAKDCAYCRTCPDDGGCSAYHPGYLSHPAIFGTWIDEPNSSPRHCGDLSDLIRAARRTKSEAARLRPRGHGFYLLSSDLPAGVYYNTYGWDDLARYHVSEAFDIVGTLRRGGNPSGTAVGGAMSEFPETSINGIRQVTRRLADDVTDRHGRQGKPVWMLVNGGSGRIVTDPGDPAYPASPHTLSELLAQRPDAGPLRYMLYTAILNGATGLLFYQDGNDSLLTPLDPYWKDVLLPASSELAVLGRDTGFLTKADYNDLEYRLTGNSGEVDSMLKRSGPAWILVVTNSSPGKIAGVEFVLAGGSKLEGIVERLSYRHDPKPARRRFEGTPAGTSGGDRFSLDLPGYGVALYRFRVAEARSRRDAGHSADPASLARQRMTVKRSSSVALSPASLSVTVTRSLYSAGGKRSSGRE